MNIEAASLNTGISRESHNKLRKWFIENINGSNYLSQCKKIIATSVAWRVMRFGQEQCLADFHSTYLTIIGILLPPSHNLQILKAALIRSELETNTKISTILREVPELSDTQAWLDQWSNPDCEIIQNKLEEIKNNNNNEETVTARAIASRNHPRLIEMDWIKATKETKAASPAARILLLECIKSRPDLADTALEYLDNEYILFSGNIHDDLPDLLTAAPSMNERACERFDYAFDELSSLTAARNFIEINDTVSAMKYLQRARPLSKHYDKFQLLLVHLHCHNKDHQKAFNVYRNIEGKALSRQALTCVFDHFPDELLAEEVASAAMACTNKEPETFYKMVLGLLEIGRIDDSRMLCEKKMEEFSAHEPLSSILNTIINKT